jgi:hypothetical protein
MSNTVIQIKRSTGTTTPPGGSLSAAELAYSYASDRLFIGTANGLSVNEIGGTYWVNHTIAAFEHANSVASAANAWLGTVAASGNAWANTVGTSGNAYAEFVGASANTYATDTFYAKTGGTISGDVVVSGNLTISGVTTYANTQTLNVGDNIFVLNADLPAGASPSENAGMEVNRGNQNDVAILWDESQTVWTFTNDGSTYHQIASNTFVNSVAASANAYAQAVGVAGNNYTDAVGAAGNAYTVAVGTAGNAYTNAVNTKIFQTFSDAANLVSGIIASARVSGTYSGITGVGTLTSGTWNADTITVPYGGTGKNLFTTNGILFGNNAGSLQVTSAGTEGQVLQADAFGVPAFGMLDGGTF